MADGTGMALPGTFKYILVALAAMVAFRFVNELKGPDVPGEGNATSTEKVDVAATEGGHALEGVAEKATEKGVTAKSNKAGKKSKVGGEVRRHNLKKNEVLIEFCASWQYKSTYNQVLQVIQVRALADLEVRGAEYPPPPEMVFYSQIAFYVQMAAFAVVFFGDSIFSALKVDPPPMLRSLQENKFASFMFIWLIGNMASGAMLNTKAFEIHHGDQLIWSSLETGRLPAMNDLVRAFRKTGVEFMQMQRDEN